MDDRTRQAALRQAVTDLLTEEQIDLYLASARFKAGVETLIEMIPVYIARMEVQAVKVEERMQVELKALIHADPREEIADLLAAEHVCLYETGTPPLGEDPNVWYVAVCHDCEPVLPQPFTTARERATWVTAHRDGTGHRVTVEDQRKSETTTSK